MRKRGPPTCIGWGREVNLPAPVAFRECGGHDILRHDADQWLQLSSLGVKCIMISMESMNWPSDLLNFS